MRQKPRRDSSRLYQRNQVQTQGRTATESENWAKSAKHNGSPIALNTSMELNRPSGMIQGFGSLVKHWCAVGVVGSWFTLAAANCFGQGTLTITFNGYPRAGAGVYIPYYTESGMLFEPLPGSGGFVRMNGTGTSLWPDNGTAYLQATLGDSLSFGFQNKSLFDLISVDLAGYSTVVPDGTAYFFGYRADGSVVSASFAPNGTVFQTFYFGSEFQDLVQVDVPGFGSLDNVVLTIPEPSGGKLFILCTIILWAARKGIRRATTKK
jgi:hypothetical protein